MTITSVSGNRIKRLKKLIDKPRLRREEGCFVAEGVRIVSETPPERIRELYVTEALMKEAEDTDNPCYRLLSSVSEDRIFTVTEEVYRKLSDTITPQGILAVVSMEMAEPADIYGSGTPLVLVLCDIQDPGNLGTMIRTSEGAGLSGVIMSRGCADIYSPKVVRATMGSLYRVRYAVAEDIKKTLTEMKDSGIELLGAELSGSVSYDDVDYNVPCAVLIGNEGTGLDPDILGLCDQRIRIPMEGKLDSLNAGISAAVITYEAARQRRH